MKITEIQRFCMHDGPGIRTTVFVKGCPLHCAWCHNPETQNSSKELLFFKSKCIFCKTCLTCENHVHSFTDVHDITRKSCVTCGKCTELCPTNALEIVGKDMSAEELFESVQRDTAFYAKDGGVTVSGGEPFSQHEEVIEFLKLCNENNINTTVETCGVFPSHITKEAVKYVDMFLWDIKDTDSARHKTYTGLDNKLIIDNLLLADKFGAKTLLRCIMLQGINMNAGHYSGIANIYNKLKNCIGVELIPYHSFGLSKAEALGRDIVTKVVAGTAANRLIAADWMPVCRP